MNDSDFLPKPGQQPEGASDKVKPAKQEMDWSDLDTEAGWRRLLKEGYTLVENLPEGKDIRFARLVGILNRLFDGDFENKKIVDLASGGANAGSNEVGYYQPKLAAILSSLGAKVLAVDKGISEKADYPFATKRLDLKDFSPERLTENWRTADVVLSTSFFGQPSNQAEINELELIKEAAKIAPIQVHQLTEYSDILDRKLETGLAGSGLKVVFNSLNRSESRLVVIQKEEEKTAE